MITKIDYAIAILVGFLTGVFAIPTVLNLGVRNFSILALLPLLVSLLWVLGIWLVRLISRWLVFMVQFGKFAEVGFLNTAIDFGILNLLSALSGVTSGFIIGGVNVPGFSVAVINSYFWNKFWVFRTTEREGVLQDFPKFFGVTVVGLLINSGIVVSVTTFVGPLFGLGAEAWLNVAKVAATAVSFVWNFLGYKFLVFRRLPPIPG